MARGKRASPEDIYKVIASYAVTNSIRQTARDLNIPVTTVKNIIDKHKGDSEFEQLRTQKKDEFAKKASEIIEKGLTLLDRRFDRAICAEEELDELVNEIEKGPLSPSEKEKITNKIRAIQMYDIKAITTAIGTLYDKKALAEGSATDNVSVSIKLPKGIDEYAD